MIRFINHASFTVSSGGKTLVCDPWIAGTAFQDGWNLIAEEEHPALSEIDYIWYSHEHPDHFSVGFLKSIAEKRRKDITILYQQTHDGRVLGFAKKLGFQTRELPDAQRIELGGGLALTCGKIPFYDSWALIETPHYSILNSNDCILESPDRLSLIKQHVSRCDILFTQFSYANWQDRQDNPAARRSLAADKLNRIKIQCETFRPHFVVPFASFVYFSHRENSYMNADINRPDLAVDFIENNCSGRPVLMYPNELWDGVSEKPNDDAKAYWRAKYDAALVREKHQAKAQYDMAALTQKADAMIARVGARNNLMLIRAMQLFGVIKPVVFRVNDAGGACIFDWRNGLRRVANAPTDAIQIHSESLAFIFDNDFGVDTVNVNARFDAAIAGKRRMIRLFSVLALNNTGRFIKFRDFRNFLNWEFIRQGLRTAGLVGGRTG